MHDHIIFLERYINGCRLIYLKEEQPVAAVIDLDGIPHLNDIYCGRILRLESAYAWVDIGFTKPALLKRKKQNLQEGQYVAVRISRQPIQNAFENKGPQVVLEPIPLTHPTIQLIHQAPPQWLSYLMTAKEEQTIKVYINDIRLFQQAKAASLPPSNDVILQQAQPCSVHVQQCWEDLMQDVHPLPQGGHIIVQETAALTVFDVNTSAFEYENAHRSLMNVKERMRFNQMAAETVFKLIGLRQIGGTIFVDFLKLNEASLDKQFILFLRGLSQSVRDLRILGYTPGGLVEIRRPVYGPSLKARFKKLMVNKEVNNGS